MVAETASQMAAACVRPTLHVMEHKADRVQNSSAQSPAAKPHHPAVMRFGDAVIDFILVMITVVIKELKQGVHHRS